MDKKWLPYYLFACMLFTACSNKYQKFVANYTYKTHNGLPDYQNLNNWASHPYKPDPSDSIPRPLRKNYRPDSTVDVFFIHPTTYTSPDKMFGWNAPVDDAELNAKTDYSTILFQAGIFNEVGRIFSPRYRQAHLSAYFPVTTDDSAKALAAFELAYQDVKTAFTWYLENENHGKPIIIASHSQGTTHAKRLLKEFFDGKSLQNQLVAAYLVGIPLEPDYFSFIPSCKTPLQTGCACGWRTYKEGFIPEYVQKEKFISVVTNPLTWDSSITSAKRSINKGALLLNFNVIVKKVADAQVGKGILWTRKPHFFGNLFLTTKNYHIADMNLYYLSIRENASQRSTAFKNKQGLLKQNP